MIPRTIFAEYPLSWRVASKGALVLEGDSITLAFNRQATVIIAHALELSRFLFPLLPYFLLLRTCNPL